MLTLDQIDAEFETNANSTGLQKFLLVKKGVTPAGKSVYIYQRSFTEGARLGQIAGFEVVIPKTVKAGTVYKFPGGVEKTVADDMEVYPNGVKTDFGKRAWFCANLERAEIRFNELTTVKIEIPDTDDDDDIVHFTSKTAAKKIIEDGIIKVGRPKSERPALALPDGEFSVTEVAEKNGVEYITASVFVKEQLGAGVLETSRKERRSARGKETQLYKKTELTLTQ